MPGAEAGRAWHRRRNQGGQDLTPSPGSGRARFDTIAGRAPDDYGRSPLSSFGGLDAECPLPTGVVAARPAQARFRMVATRSGRDSADILSGGCRRRSAVFVIYCQ